MKYAPLMIAMLAFAPLAANAADGKTIFAQQCTACHGATGDGIPGVFPPVRQSDYVKKATPAQLVHIISRGLTGEVVVNGKRYNSVMPPVNLSEADTAAVLNYLVADLNGGKATLTADQVKKLKAAK